MSDSDSEVENNLKKRKMNSSDNEDSPDGNVEAEFLFNDPSSTDFEGVLTLLQGSLKSFDWKLPDSVKKDRYSYLSELVSNQPNIGTVIKVDDQDDSYVMAVLSLLNLSQYQGLDSLKEVLLEKSDAHSTKEDSKKLKEVLSDPKNQIGLLINERMGNVPSQLLGKLQECLKEDIKWSKENAEDEDEKKYYKFTHILGVSRLYRDKTKEREKDSNLVYQKPEEKFYFDNSEFKFMWPTGESNKVNYFDHQNRRNMSKILPEYMFVYCLNFYRFNFVVKEIVKNFKE